MMMATMLEAVELPAGVANLATGLPDVDGDAPENRAI